MTKVIVNGEEVNFVAVVNVMDEVLRKTLHATFEARGDDWDEQRFVDQYCDLHYEKFGREFAVTAQPAPVL